MLVFVTFFILKNQYIIAKPFFEKPCIDLEIWSRESGYSDKLVQKQILKARKQNHSTSKEKKENGERGGGVKSLPLSKIYHTYSSMMKLGIVILYVKIYKSHEKPLEFC